MNLALSLTRAKNSWYVYLSEEESNPYKIFISSKNLSDEFNKKWFTPLFEKDKSRLIKYLSPNQFIVVIYFYLAPYTPSSLIMKQWFTDIGCDFFNTDYLCKLVLDSRNDENNDWTTFYETFYEINNSENILSYKEVDLNGKIYWNYEFPNSSIQDEDISTVKLIEIEESHFIIEDHACIIIGFSVNYTSFIEVISGYRPDSLDSLCNLIPLKNRDTKTLSQIIMENPEIEEILTKTFYRGIEFYGINQVYKLIKYNEKDFVGNSTKSKHNFQNMMTDISNTISVIPLFIKFIK